MTATNAQRLAELIRAFTAGDRMPERIKTDDGAAVRLAEWLTDLRYDRTEFQGHEADLIGVQSFPPQINEVAHALRARIAEAARKVGIVDAPQETSVVSGWYRAGITEVVSDPRATDVYSKASVVTVTSPR